MGVKFLALTLLTICASYVESSEKNVVCYYGTWATYRWGNGKFDVEHVNPYLCTHLVYAFVGINFQGNVISLDPFVDLPDFSGKDNFRKLNALKQKNPKLKTILAVGGWNEGSGKYSVMSADPTLRQNFIHSALNMVQTYGFDGFDLDWEYPARRDTIHGRADIENFTKLVKEMKEEFQKYGLLVTAATSSVEDMASLSYDIPAICQYLDFVGLMTYDFYGAWDPVTGHNAALHKGEGFEATPREKVYAVDTAVEYWLKKDVFWSGDPESVNVVWDTEIRLSDDIRKAVGSDWKRKAEDSAEWRTLGEAYVQQWTKIGCPPEKLVVGLAFYGRTFTLLNENVNGVGAPAIGPGIAGPFTVSPGSLGYNEFCNIMQSESGWEVRYDEQAAVPYAVNGRNWVSYDDPDSLTKKIEWGLSKKVAGFMVWSIETDDFHGVCGEDFPLLRAMNRAIGRNVDDNEEQSTTENVVTAIPVTTESTTKAEATDTTGEETDATTVDVSTIEAFTTTTTSAPTTKSATTEADVTGTIPGDDKPLCSSEGIIAHPYNCTQFLMCIGDGRGGLLPIDFDCPPETQFDQDKLYCDFAYIVKCQV